jgi:UDP-glucuronate 4-epimerase
MTDATTSGDPAAWADALPDAAPILVTGAAGFIGAALSLRLLEAGKTVIGLDNLTPYYDPGLKEARLARLSAHPRFAFERLDLADRAGMAALFDRHPFAHVVHLGAQAGVRYSIDNPHAYADSNLTGFLNILEGCRAAGTTHLVYASSSSVYGGNRKIPFAVSDSVDHPVSLYAATKKANELMAHAYADLYGFAATGLRFFTVYGDWGRPDMAYWKFTEAILNGDPIKVFNNGDMERDFTHVDDIVESVLRLIPRPALPDPAFDRMAPDPGRSWAPHRVFNIGNSRRERLMDMIALIEQALGREAVKEFLPMQAGDVQSTWADVSALEAEVAYVPQTLLSDGIPRFVAWYRAHYGV